MVVTQKDRIYIKSQVDLAFTDLIKQQDQSLNEYLNDALFPGRRMRPTLLYMLLGKGKSEQTRMHLFKAIELIHRSSIILDDLIDDDDERRGVKAFHIKHGANATMLTSHYINSLAYKEISTFKEKTGIDFTSDFSECYSMMVMGEMADINLLTTQSNFLAFYNNASLKKTNALFILIMKIFFKVKYRRLSSLNIIQNIGEYFGNIYQIQNDIYDELYASLDERGEKTVYYNCLTLPKAIVLDTGTEQEKKLLRSVLGKSITKEKQLLIREIFSKDSYLNELRAVLKNQKNKLSESMKTLTGSEQKTFTSFMDWLENKHCWNHNEFINAGY